MDEVAEVTGVAARIGDQVALPFEDFYLRERTGLVRALTLVTGDAATAADAIDEAMARALQRWRSVGTYEHPAGWVYRVAVNVSRSRWRRTRRLVLGPATPERATTGDPDPVADEALWAAVARLPLGQRDAVVLRFVLDWDHARIGNALGIEESSARSRVTRGIASLRAALEVQP